MKEKQQSTETRGQYIKRLRIEAELTQRQLSKLIGARGHSYLCAVERGADNPSELYVKKIEKVLASGIGKFAKEWHNLTEESVAEDKKESFRNIKPALDALIKEIM